MKVSVIIPCHNAEAYLAQTLGSVLRQTHRAHEIIVVDDDSSDESVSVLARFAASRPELVRPIRLACNSAARARNVGAAESDGDAILFLDADDVLGPDALAGLVAALEGAGEAIAACAWQRLEFVQDRWISRPPSCSPRCHDQDDLAAWLSGWYVPPCALLWSRRAFAGTGGWDERITVNDDGDLVMRALADGVSLRRAARGVAYYRRHPTPHTSLSGRGRTEPGLASRLEVVGKIAQRLGERGRLPRYRQPLHEAFACIARDADGVCDVIAREARQQARRLRPGPLQRLTRRLLPPRLELQPPLPRDREIRFGLDVTPEPAAAAAARPTEPTAPLVSVIIPTHHRPQMLRRALVDVLGQAFTRHEVLVIDDGPSDDAAAVVAACADPRVRYLRQPGNLGVAAARNRGLREARGAWVAFLDDDDQWDPRKLALQVELAQACPPDVGLIYTGVETMLPGGSSSVQQPTARGDVHRQLLERNVIHGGGSNVLLRRAVIAQVGFFDERLPAIEDWDYWLRVARRWRVDCVPQPLLRYDDQAGTVQDGPRRSRRQRANRRARAMFYEKHGAAMRQAGVAHRFLMESARRCLQPPEPDVPQAIALALRAATLNPFDRAARRVLGQALASWRRCSTAAAPHP